MKTKNILIIILSALLIIGCGVCKPNIPGPSNNVNVRDSIVYHQVDSINYIPVEVIKDIVPVYDTLKMETSLAEAKAYLDTTNKVLRGEIKNKKGITNKIQYKEKIVYRDSIVTKPYPVEVEKIVTKKPWYTNILWFFSIIGLAWLIKIGISLYVKFKGA